MWWFLDYFNPDEKSLMELSDKVRAEVNQPIKRAKKGKLILIITFILVSLPIALNYTSQGEGVLIFLIPLLGVGLFLIPPIRNLVTNLSGFLINKISLIFFSTPEDRERVKAQEDAQQTKDKLRESTTFQAMRKIAENEFIKKSFSFALSGFSVIQLINENRDNSLSEQQKQAYKIEIFLLARKYKKYFSRGLTLSAILLIFGILFWWPLLICTILSFLWGISCQLGVRGLIGSNSQAVKIEIAKLGGEEVITETNFKKEFAKGAGTSENI